MKHLAVRTSDETEGGTDTLDYSTETTRRNGGIVGSDSALNIICNCGIIAV
jgi:hypothetical protein